MARPKNKLCCFCGNPALTMDHIPPDGIFPYPKPQNLITVPACVPCNEQSSLDEEYFRAIITPAAFNNQWAEKLIYQKIIPGFKQKSALIRSIMKKSQKLYVTSEGGIYIGKLPALQYDPIRIQNVINKIVRGLFWHEKRDILGSDYIVKRFLLNPPFSDKLQAGIGTLPLKKVGSGEVFSYRYLTDSDNPRISCWYLMFFEATLFMAITEAKSGDAI